MSLVSFARLAPVIAGCLAACLLCTTPAAAQDAVSCGNGLYCPAGNACLVGGQCGLVIASAPGSVRTSTGGWCDPGFREHKYTPGICVPNSYSDCPSGRICPGGTTCSSDGQTCEGGPEAAGPYCGSLRCAKDRVCASNGACMNPEYYQDCGNGTICTKSSACEFPKGCVFVSPARTQQFRR